MSYSGYWRDSITDSAGNALRDAMVEVRLQGETALADIATRQAGAVTPAANPLPVNALGALEFFAQPGLYTLTIISGSTSTTRDVGVFPLVPADFDFSRAAEASNRPIIWATDARWGAVGDGVTDSTAAIQAAIDYAYSLVTGIAPAKRGTKVWLPNGEYVISSLTVPNGVDLCGENVSFTVLVAKPDSPGPMLRLKPTSLPLTSHIQRQPHSLISRLLVNANNSGSLLISGGRAVAGSPVVFFTGDLSEVQPGYLVLAQGVVDLTYVTSKATGQVTLSANSLMTWGCNTVALLSNTVVDGTPRGQAVVSAGVLSLIWPGQTVSGVGIASGTTVLSVSGTTEILTQQVTQAISSALDFGLRNVVFLKAVRKTNCVLNDESASVYVGDTSGIQVGMAVRGQGIRDQTHVKAIASGYVTLTIAASSGINPAVLFFTLEKHGLLIENESAADSYSNTGDYPGVEVANVHVTNTSGDGVSIGPGRNMTELFYVHVVYSRGSGIVQNSAGDCLVTHCMSGSNWKSALRVGTAATPRFIDCEFWQTQLSDRYPDVDINDVTAVQIAQCEINGRINLGDSNGGRNAALLSGINFIQAVTNRFWDNSPAYGVIEANGYVGVIATGCYFLASSRDDNDLNKSNQYLIYTAGTAQVRLIDAQIARNSLDALPFSTRIWNDTNDVQYSTGLGDVVGDDSPSQRATYAGSTAYGKSGSSQADIVFHNRSGNAGKVIAYEYDETERAYLQMSPSGPTFRKSADGQQALGIGSPVVGDGWKEPARLGSHFMWVDGSGRLRLSYSLPATDTDGAIVGTQS